MAAMLQFLVKLSIRIWTYEVLLSSFRRKVQLIANTLFNLNTD